MVVVIFSSGYLVVSCGIVFHSWVGIVVCSIGYPKKHFGSLCYQSTYIYNMVWMLYNVVVGWGCIHYGGEVMVEVGEVMVHIVYRDVHLFIY